MSAAALLCALSAHSAAIPRPPVQVADVPALLLCEQKKKTGMESVNSRLQLVMKSGKASLGYKTTLKSLRQGKCMLSPKQVAPCFGQCDLILFQLLSF